MADEKITCPFCGQTGDWKWFEEHDHDNFDEEDTGDD